MFAATLASLYTKQNKTRKQWTKSFGTQQELIISVLSFDRYFDKLCSGIYTESIRTVCTNKHTQREREYTIFLIISFCFVNFLQYAYIGKRLKKPSCPRCASLKRVTWTRRRRTTGSSQRTRAFLINHVDIIYLNFRNLWTNLTISELKDVYRFSRFLKFSLL